MCLFLKYPIAGAFLFSCSPMLRRFPISFSHFMFTLHTSFLTDQVAQLAKKTWAKDPIRARTPEVELAAQEVAALPDVWVGRHVTHWQDVAGGGDLPLERQFGNKLKKKIMDRNPPQVVGRVSRVG